MIASKSCWTSGCECPGQCLYAHNNVTECVQCWPQNDTSSGTRSCIDAALDTLTCPENQVATREQFQNT